MKKNNRNEIEMWKKWKMKIINEAKINQINEIFLHRKEMKYHHDNRLHQEKRKERRKSEKSRKAGNPKWENNPGKYFTEIEMFHQSERKWSERNEENEENVSMKEEMKSTGSCTKQINQKKATKEEERNEISISAASIFPIFWNVNLHLAATINNENNENNGVCKQ